MLLKVVKSLPCFGYGKLFGTTSQYFRTDFNRLKKAKLLTKDVHISMLKFHVDQYLALRIEYKGKRNRLKGANHGVQVEF